MNGVENQENDTGQGNGNVTGHTTPEMLKRYIKADQLDVVQKLTDKYDYFD